MFLYHGSRELVKHPEYGKGKIHNDYGRGFYCTEHKELAMEWAVDYKQNGFVNCYELDEAELKVLNLSSDDYCMLNWLAILLMNRTFASNSPIEQAAKEYIVTHFGVDCEGADVITGYRADDSYFSFAHDFIKNMISYSQLCKAMFLGNLGEQVVIKSKKGFEHLHFTGYEIAETKYWYPKKKYRVDSARNDYFETKRNISIKGELFVYQIIAEEMGIEELKQLERGMK